MIKYYYFLKMADQSTMSLGDRMKSYEVEGFNTLKLDNDKPFMARIDGHSFSKFTSGFGKPYDLLLSTAMIRTTGDLVDEFQARTGYTQSDEITLVFIPVKNQESGEWANWSFNGRIIKLATLMASYASVRFNYHLMDLTKDETCYSDGVMKRIQSQKAHFDARLFSVPNEIEVFNNILWRSTYDCIRNSISGLARKHFSTKQIHKKNTHEMKKMLLEKGIDYEEMPGGFKYGSFVKKEKYEIEGVDNKTNELVTTMRSRIRVWSKELRGFDAEFMELLVRKYY